MADRSSSEQRDDRKHLLYVGLVVATVIIVLGVGLWLNKPDSDEATPIADGIGEVEAIDTLARVDDADLVPAETEEADEVATSPDPTLLTLAERAEADLVRIESYQTAYTLQLLNACDPTNVAPHAERFAGEDRFYLLPSFVNDAPCFRVCWGRYPTLDAARAADDVPASLLALTETPYPRRIGEVLP
ncbi:MAG: hypothetical protein OEV00_09055 [Acidobacteriota bacterium]|nr:hypothetical protein [Acidobacteriota bacterium]MDH3785459.1 hypothetical protein [Acidobacteriota bacterium]